MEFLADEHVDPEWRHALEGDGHDVVRVLEHHDLEPGTTDHRLLSVATAEGRVLLTADQSDCSTPPLAEHAGVLVINDGSVTGGDVRRAVRRLDRLLPDREAGPVPDRVAVTDRECVVQGGYPRVSLVNGSRPRSALGPTAGALERTAATASM